MAVGMLLTGLSVQAQQNQNKFGGQTGNYDPGMRPDFKAERPSPEQVAKQQTAQLKKDLSLDPVLEKKVFAINLDYAQQYEEQVKNSPDMTEYDKAMLKKIREDHKTALKGVLTEEQWNLYQKKEKERKERMLEEQRGHQ